MNEAKELLKEIRHIDGLIKSKLEEMQDLRHMAITATLDDSPKGNSVNNDKILNIIIHIEEIETALNDNIDVLVSKKQNVICLINQIASIRERHLLMIRYIRLKKWHEISEEFGMEERHVQRIHGHALKSFDEVYKKTTNVSKCH